MIKLKALKELFFCFLHNGIFFTRTRKLLFLSRFMRFIKPIPVGYFSQEGQDKIAHDILLNLGVDIASLSIVDIGSNHPVILNNTLYFEKEKSANVFSIEPNPEFIPIYKEHNRKLLNIAIGNKEEELTLYIPKRELGVGYSDNVHASLVLSEIPKSGLLNMERKKVPVKPLGRVIPSGNYNLLFIDVEGFEMNVLSGINFDDFSFDLIFIENNSQQRSTKEIWKFMTQKGYSYFGRIHGLDDIYIK